MLRMRRSLTVLAAQTSADVVRNAGAVQDDEEGYQQERVCPHFLYKRYMQVRPHLCPQYVLGSMTLPSRHGRCDALVVDVLNLPYKITHLL